MPTSHPKSLSPDDLTAQLNAWIGGEPRLSEQLVAVLYPLMRRIAESLFARERVDHTLQPTALVHEGFIRLMALRQIQWLGREHFLSTAARLMRRVLVDHARATLCKKRGGDRDKQPLELAFEVPEERAAELVALDDALFTLRRVDREKAAIVELQYFGGLSFNQIAALLGRSRSTVIRHWKLARLWLLDELATTGFPDAEAAP